MNQITDTPFLIRNINKDGFLRTNESFSARVGYTVSELSTKPFMDWIISDDHSRIQEVLNGKTDSCRVRHLAKYGEPLDLIVKASLNSETGHTILARFVEEVKLSKLESTSGQANIKSTLNEIAQIIEEQNPEFKCSILLVEDGKFVKGAGPSLPDSYNNAIDGFAIGPMVGSCGTAIYWNVPVIVTNIQEDPLWTPFAELAKEAGVNACWSHPFVSKSGSVLGALAFYSSKANKPTSEQLQQLRAAARLTGLAVERGRAEEALRLKHEKTLELENQLRQAAKMEALGVLTGGVAHDFNNVLATVMANAELSLMMLESTSDKTIKENITKRLYQIVKASKRAGNFCNQMLSYAGHGKVEMKKSEIGSLISEIDSLVNASISKNTTLTFELDQNPIFVNGDENQILQVIMNLVTNAADVLKKSGGKITVTTGVKNFDSKTLKQISPEHTLKPGEYACLSVSDDGKGMSDDVKSKIFDPFYTTKETGRGLGLSAVKGIIKMHDGAMMLDSEVGKGTVFTVLLPTIKSDIKPESIDDNETRTNVVQTNKTILFAEDEKSLRETLSESFEMFGYNVVAVSNGKEAIDKFQNFPQNYDCILLDFSMPKFNGIEVAKAIDEVNNKIPMLLMSDYNENESIDDNFKSRFSNILQKPVKIKDLKNLLDQILGD